MVDAFSRRYITQVKQAINDFEVKYEKRIRNIKVISNEQNVDIFLESICVFGIGVGGVRGLINVPYFVLGGPTFLGLACSCW